MEHQIQILQTRFVFLRQVLGVMLILHSEEQTRKEHANPELTLI